MGRKRKKDEEPHVVRKNLPDPKDLPDPNDVRDPRKDDTHDSERRRSRT